MRVRRTFVSVVVAGAFLLAGCGGGGGGSSGGDSGALAPQAPTLSITTPASNLTARIGAAITLQYADLDVDGVAMTFLFADRDGDPTTTNDSFDITRARPDQGGATQTVTWETRGLTAGVYHVFGTSWDGLCPPVTVEAAGTVELQANAWSGGGGGDDYPNGSAVFPDGSSVVVGSFTFHTVFGAGEPNETVLDGEGQNDVFVVRYAPDGTLAWAKHAGGTDYDQGMDVATFADGTCVVTGMYRGTATFGAGELGQTVLVSVGATDDVFTARYAADGTLLWAESAGGPNYERSNGVATFPDGSCVVGGTFNGSATFGAGEPSQTVLGGGGDDVFVARYSSTGSLLWAKSGGGGSYDNAGGIAAFSDGSCVIGGMVQVPATFGAGEPNQTDLGGGGQAAFVARLNADGTLAWAKSSSGGSVTGQETAAFSDGSCVIAGPLSGTATFGLGDPNQTVLQGPSGMFMMGSGAFIARYDASGALVWAKVANPSTGLNVRDLATFPDGTCVLAGDVSTSYGGGATFGVGEANETTLFGLGSNEACLARYGTDGTLAWAVAFGGRDGHYAVGVDVLTDGSLLVAGWFQFEATFGFGLASETTVGSAVTYSDVFVARFAGDGSF